MTSLYSHDKAGNSGEWYCCFHAIVINLETQRVGLARLIIQGTLWEEANMLFTHKETSFSFWQGPDLTLYYLIQLLRILKPLLFTKSSCFFESISKLLVHPKVYYSKFDWLSAYRFPNRVIKILVFFNKASFFYSKFETILVFM